MYVPQIRCPRCGETITLKNRRKIDFDLIVTTVKKEPRNFTELLKITQLSRKTLSLRLKELCENRVLYKKEGKYGFEGSSQLWNSVEKSVEKWWRRPSTRKVRIGLIFISLMLLSSASGYSLGMFVQLSKTPQMDHMPPILGSFTMALDINEVNNLYAWQAVILYNTTELEVTNATHGSFLGGKSFFVSKTIIAEGLLHMGGTLLGPIPGVNGTGRLAVITFAQFTETFSEPKLVPSAYVFSTTLLDPSLNEIPISNGTLTLSLIENQ